MLWEHHIESDNSAWVLFGLGFGTERVRAGNILANFEGVEFSRKIVWGRAFLAEGSIWIVAARFPVHVGHSYWCGELFRGLSVKRWKERERGIGY